MAFETGDGCYGQIVCDCLEEGVNWYVLDIFEKAFIAKWIGAYNDDTTQNYTKSEEGKTTPRCNQSKWKQVWLLEHRNNGDIIYSRVPNRRGGGTFY